MAVRFDDLVALELAAFEVREHDVLRPTAERFDELAW
jgi:hypothetical protein